MEHLLCSKEVEKTKAGSITLTNVMLSVAYLISAGTLLRPFYPNLKHLTCLVVHTVHRVVEEVCFQHVSPSRVNEIKEKLPDTPLSPELTLTRKIRIKVTGTHAAQILKKKLESFVSRNPGYETINEIYHVLNGNARQFPEGFRVATIVLLKNVPIT
ncbi:hypothetical protein PR048_006452 [Dryococelus australis]|uniref:Uncharacterized protein n=1 Tax=Dryococelus australis TaxID=614101 RepID=A0ABQ9IB38_9NEOP|nr:hypothetical protein PR048_006452 [Dryococelus australis]